MENGERRSVVHTIGVLGRFELPRRKAAHRDCNDLRLDMGKRPAYRR